jgi:hypothetical protein
MNPHPRFGRTDVPVHLLEVATFDAANGRAIDPAQFGRVEAPVAHLATSEFESSPHLVLTLVVPAAVKSAEMENAKQRLIATVEQCLCNGLIPPAPVADPGAGRQQ